jgi:MFS family permease
VLSAYAPLFRVPGAGPFIAGTAVSRVGGAMFGVSVIVMVSERRGSFGLAGAVSAAGLAVLAVAGPVLGRLIDRHGQRRVALPFVVLSAVTGTATAVASWREAPVWTLVVLYGASAFLPEPGPLSRARWAHIFREDPARLHTAMSFEQVADETSFVVGPVLAVLVSTLWFPEAGLLLATLLFTAGAIAFLSARATEPPVVPHAERPAGLAVRWPGLLVVATVLVMTGAILGANEVVAVAFAQAHGDSSFSSVILGGFAFGSAVAGVVVGGRVFRSSLTRRLLVAASAMLVLELPALLVPGTWSLAVVMLVAGCATAPMLITSMSLAQRLVPPALMTEGLAVAVTGILIGISGGSAVGGWAVEAWGAQSAYLVPVLAGAVAVGIIVLRYRRLASAERDGAGRGVVHGHRAPPDPLAPAPGVPVP